jgi:hypothetical protein
MAKFSYTVKKYPLPNSYGSYDPLPPLGNGTAADFNQDGRLDIVYSLDISSTNNTNSTPVGIFTNTGKGFTPYKLTINGNKNQWPEVKFGMYIATADINGDRIPDIIPIDQSEAPNTNGKGTFEGNYQYAYISTSRGKYQKVQIGDDKYGVHGYGTIESADKKFKILYNTPWTENAIGGTSTVVSTYDVKTKQFVSEKFASGDSFYSWLPDQHKEFFYQTTVDVNNDGNTDIVGFTSLSGKNGIYLNNGHGKFNFTKEFSTGLSSDVRVEEITIGDFNGDGLKDMVVMGVQGSNYNKTLKVLINKNGKEFVDKSAQYLGGKFNNIDSSYGYLDSFDINKDGLTDFTWNHNTSNNNAGNWIFDVFVSNGNSFELHTIENTVGARIIPMGNNSFYDGTNLITLKHLAKSKVSVVKAAAWIPGEYDDYVITKGKGYNIFTSESEQYWISNTKKNINFDDYSILLNSQAKLIGLPTPIPSDWG